MLGAIATVVAYTRKPKPTYVLRHPVQAVRIMKFRHDVREAFTPGRIAVGLGVAALAVPLGLWLGRRASAGEPPPEELPRAA